MPAGSHAVLEAGCFPLVPYANRIANGRFTYGGHEVELPVLPRFAPHALHGDAWLASWDVLDSRHGAISLIYRHPADAWPWAYEAKQILAIIDDRLRIDLSVTNLSDEAMPAGLGLHPYFRVSDVTRLSLKAPDVWTLSDDEIPLDLKPASAVFDWSDGPLVHDAPFVDHCYGSWNRQAEFTGDLLEVTVAASANARWAHVYAPGEAFCCVEPVTHRPDAIHAPADEDSGLIILAPNETLSMWVEIAVAEN